nr:MULTISPECIES: MucR family transcriptional regulator [Asticcacaulis]
MDQEQDITSIVVDIVTAYVGKNSLPAAELPALISCVHKSLTGLTSTVLAPAEAKREPAVAIKKSISNDYIVCLEDGLKFKSLKRHLRTKYNISPEEYRAKWNLPKDYPMVAPSYAAARSNLAKKMGLGSGGRSAAKPGRAKAKA